MTTKEELVNNIKSWISHDDEIKNLQKRLKECTLEKKQLTDHSTFIAFAPAEDPKIVVSVFVENGYWGSRWAAPIASLIIEKYLTGSVERKWLETRMINGSLLAEYEKPYKFQNFTINE